MRAGDPISLWHLVAFLLVIGATRVQTDDSDCLDLASRIHIDINTTIVDIDELIRVHDASNDDLPPLTHKTDTNYTIDLSCFHRISTIICSFSRLTTFSAEIMDPPAIVSFFSDESGTSNQTLRLIVSNMSSIKSLTLTNNRRLTRVPARSLSALSNLTHLDLAANGIGKKACLEPASFFGLEQLTHLNLSKNPLCTTLQPDFFASLKKLVHLDLSETSWAEDRVNEAALLEGLDNLRYLNLSVESPFNFQQSLPLDSFSAMKRLEILDLGGYISELEPQFVFENRNLTHLRMQYIHLTREVPESVFVHLSRLEWLDLSLPANATIQPKLYLTEGIFRGLSSLRSLTIAFRDLKISQVHDEVFCDTPSLSELNLSNNMLDEEVFAKLTCLGASLESLNMADNAVELRQANISVFYSLRRLHMPRNLQVDLNESRFGNLSELRVLDLSANSIPKLTARSFAGLEQLEQLNLSHNFIRTMENATFAPLTKLTWLDLSGNDLMNLYFYGLDPDCSIFLDGLLVFNITMIDLGQMVSGRQRGFLRKNMRIKNSNVSFLRNIKVDWRSASDRPNCSLYFHVLRHFKPISFELDPAYLDACIDEDLVFSSERGAFPLGQFDSRNIDRLTLWSFKPIEHEYFPNDTVYVAAVEGFLIGVNYGRLELVSLRIEASNFTRYVFKIEQDMTDFRIICANMLVCSWGSTDVLLWNMTDKTNIQGMMSIERFEVDKFVCLMQSKYLLIKNFQYLNIWDIAGKTTNKYGPYRLSSDRQSSFYDKVVVGPSQMLFSMRENRLVLWTFEDIVRDRVHQVEIESGHRDEYAYIWLEKAPDGYLISATPNGEIKVWRLTPDGTSLRLLRSLKGGSISRFAVFVSSPKNDVLIACTSFYTPLVSVWSVRYGKKINEIPFASAGYGHFVSEFSSLIYASHIDSEKYLIYWIFRDET